MGTQKVQICDSYECVRDLTRLRAWADKCASKPYYSIDTETTSTDPTKAKIVGVSLGFIEDGWAYGCYVPVAHNDGTQQLRWIDVLPVVQELLDCPARPIFHNAAYDMVVLRRHDVEIREAPEDTMLMAFCLTVREDPLNMDDLALKYLDYETVRFNEVYRPDLGMTSFADVPTDDATYYAAEDSAVTVAMYEALEHKLLTGESRRPLNVYQSIDKPVLMPIADMRFNGVQIDVEKLRDLSAEFHRDLAAVEDEILQLVGPVNVASPKQVAALLYETLQIPRDEDDDSVQGSTDEKTLEKLEGAHPVVKLIVRHRKLSKLIGTYTDKLPNMLNPETGRLHTSLNITFTHTARLSSSEPNLQNISVRSTDGKKIRAAFTARPGYKIVAADYSQIELRVVAHVSRDATLLQAFHDGVDIHLATAAKVLNKRPEDVTKDERSRAKTTNFGIVYGISAIGLSVQLGITIDAAQEFIDQYFAGLPGLATWIENQQKQGVRRGYVETIFGRRLPVTRASNAVKGSRGRARRQSTNYPIQGGAADLIRLAMTGCLDEIKQGQWDARFLLQVHDELLFEVREDQAEAFAAKVKDVMEKAGDPWVEWACPIVVDAKYGDNWLEAH